ncbi:MAG: stage II sporulation protein M [Clostridiales bacterium]|nr:stage II sporulation protein M [Clostridiales bacterium]MCF8023762.1 stage II sporulation protein M [Clostridiales bacterium]
MKKTTVVFLMLFVLLCFIFTLVSSVSNITDSLFNSVKQEFSQFAGLQPLQLLSVIFFKNLTTCLFVSFTSFFLIGIPIVLSLVVNTAIMGAILSIYPGFIIGILPHGIIEIPALCISFALGWNILRRKEKLFFKLKKRDVIFFARVVIPMLAAAAVIEIYITPVIIKWFIPVDILSLV